VPKIMEIAIQKTSGLFFLDTVYITYRTVDCQLILGKGSRQSRESRLLQQILTNFRNSFSAGTKTKFPTKLL